MSSSSPAVVNPSYDPREQKSWYWYDWANSAFTTTVVTLFFGPYITSIAKAAADANGNISFFGFPLDHGSYWATLISLSVMTQVLVLPVLGSIADSSPRKKWLLGCLAYTGADSRATVASRCSCVSWPKALPESAHSCTACCKRSSGLEAIARSTARRSPPLPS